MPVDWKCKKFDELTLHELYFILKLRSEVFVVEQHCPFLDADDRDLDCYHFCGWKEGMLAAYSRLLPAGAAYTEISIGRLITSARQRAHGYGKILMEESIAHCYRIFGKESIRIGAQLYLKRFYESFGFIQDSAVYDEDGIDHIQMVLLN